MKINSSIVSGQGAKPSATSATSSAAERGQGAASKAQPESSSGASVQLSPLSAQLAALESSLAAGEAFDAGKVEEIKQAIRNGSLGVNAEVIANKMLASIREMFGTGK